MFKLAFGSNLGNLKHLRALLKSVLLPPVFHLHNKSTPKDSRLSNPVIDVFLDEAAQHSKPTSEPFSLNPQISPLQNEGKETSAYNRVQVSHPWPEWVELMDKLSTDGYFDKTGHPFGTSEFGSKDFNQIRTACLNFARDNVDIIRFLSRKDIQVVAGAGCPSLDRKVVSSGKRLRADVGIDEGNVCGSCILRGNCERAYVKACEDEGGRTVDVMRILLTYGLDVLIELVENKPCLNKKVNESVRKLLKEVLACSCKGHDGEQLIATTPESSAPKDIATRQGDWSCPKCNFLNFSRNVKCLQCGGSFQERIRKLNEELADLPLKKGDWICDKCNFLNFAKNTRCLQCKEKPPKRVLHPGDWECESCNYINFSRNMVCLKCDYHRPKSLNSAPSPSQSTGDNRERHRTRPYCGSEKHSGDKAVDRREFVSNDQDCSNSPNDVDGFVDFPVRGGKSDLSQNLHKQEMWRMEMAERNSSNSPNDVDGFVDFPVRGGKSDLSQNLHKQEMWRMEMAERNSSNSPNDVDGFVDFPVRGGKSDLSQNLHKQEMWRMEMAERNSSNSPNDVDGFVDFPVRGGKSDLSQNLHKQEMSRMEMAEQNRQCCKE